MNETGDMETEADTTTEEQVDYRGETPDESVVAGGWGETLLAWVHPTDGTTHRIRSGTGAAIKQLFHERLDTDRDGGAHNEDGTAGTDAEDTDRWMLVATWFVNPPITRPSPPLSVGDVVLGWDGEKDGDSARLLLDENSNGELVMIYRNVKQGEEFDLREIPVAATPTVVN